MSYEVSLRRTAWKDLDALSGREYDRVAAAISALEANPRPSRVKKLADSGLWRTRVGRYRVVYAIDDDAGVVVIVRVARRKEDA